MADPSRYSDYYTPERTPFTDLGIGSLLSGGPKYPIDPRLDPPRRPFSFGNIWQDLMSPVGRPKLSKKQKKVMSAAEKAAKARAALDLELETTQAGRMMRLQDADARRRATQMPNDPRVGVPQGGFPGQLPPPPPSIQTELATSEMGRMMKLQEQDARYIAAANAAIGPRGGTNVLGGNKTGIPANPIDPREHAYAQFVDQDDARRAARGAPQAGGAGIAALAGANTGQSLPGRGPYSNLVATPNLAQEGMFTSMNGTMPYMNHPDQFDPRALPDYITPDDQFVDPRGLAGKYALSGANPGFAPGDDPNALSNRLYDSLTHIPDQIGKVFPRGPTRGRSPDPDAFAKQLTAATKPRGPYASGGTDMGAALSWGGEKAQEFFDYLGTVPVPRILGDPIGTISGALPDSKPEGPKPPADYDLSDLIDEEEAPEEGGDGKGGGKGEPDALDVQMEKYLAASDTSYDDALAVINKAYSGLEAKDNPRQAAADAYAAREGERTAALAQLAVAGGLMKSAGKSWEGAGQGVENAAGIYSQGFDRYHRALIDSATRFDERQKGDRALELSKRDAALSMWSSGRTDQRAMLKEIATQAREDRRNDATIARDEKKFARENLAKRFESEAKVLFPTDGTSEAPTPEARGEFYERWELSDKLRKYVSEDEYRARKARAAARIAAKAEVVDLDLSD